MRSTTHHNSVLIAHIPPIHDHRSECRAGFLPVAVAEVLEDMGAVFSAQ